jgi:hypothetical protein
MNAKVDSRFIQIVESACHGKLSDVEIIQTLWSGYGVCFRALLSKSGDSSQLQDITNHEKASKGPLRIVAKCASPPNERHHPRGWNGRKGHVRKLASFAFEVDFYRHLQPLTTDHCKVPQCIAVNQCDDNTVLVMEDLASVGFTETTDKLSVDHAKVVLRWLGAFHARFLGQQGAIKQRKIKIWDEGSYWHLGTREDEYNAMDESPLKQAAFKIAKSLSNATYQTVIHGDAKVANFCFTQSYNACAAVDFQYVGFGVGVKDVAYFIGSALSEDDQKHYTENCLSVYFEALKEAFLLRDAQETDSLSQSLQPSFQVCSKMCIEEVIAEWRELYSFACADFHRFLAGWSPQHWKINEQLQLQTNKALKRINQNDS